MIYRAKHGMWWFQIWPFRLALNEGGYYAVFNLYAGGEYKFFIYLGVRLFGEWRRVSKFIGVKK